MSAILPNVALLPNSPIQRRFRVRPQFFDDLLQPADFRFQLADPFALFPHLRQEPINFGLFGLIGFHGAPIDLGGSAINATKRQDAGYGANRMIAICRAGHPAIENSRSDNPAKATMQSNSRLAAPIKTAGAIRREHRRLVGVPIGTRSNWRK